MTIVERPSRPAMFVGSLIAVGIALIAVSIVSAVDPRLTVCGGNDSGNKVQMTFEMAHGRDFWTHFPNAGKAPELEVEAAAYVVVFDGPAVHPLMVPNPDPDGTQPAIRLSKRDNVVCVVIDESMYLYSNVNTTGFMP